MEPKAKLSEHDKQRLGVLWVLLNATTEYGGDASKIVDVMRMIEKRYPQAEKMWSKSFEIKVGDKIIYKWNDGEISIS